jgi:hypothetical protein
MTVLEALITMISLPFVEIKLGEAQALEVCRLVCHCKFPFSLSTEIKKDYPS